MLNTQRAMEAKQFTMTNKQRVFNWASEIQYNISPSFDDNDKPCLIVPIIGGESICHISDYLILMSPTIDHCSFTVCTQAEYDETYGPTAEPESKEHPQDITYSILDQVH